MNTAFIILLLSFITYSYAEIERFQTTDFNCRCDTVDGICACYMRWADKEVQYTNVKDHAKCNRHACFLVEDGTLNCMGRVFSTLGGNQIFNPLTPNVDNKGFDLSNESVMEIDHEFRGYNLKTAYLEYNVITQFDKNIIGVECDGLYGTCVLTNEGKMCFGVPGNANFYNDFVSLVLGILVQFALAFPIFMGMKYCLRNRPNALYFCSVMVAAPIVIFFSILIVNFTTDFFVKMYIYIIGSGIGLVTADLSATVLIRLINYCCMSKIEIEMNKEQSVELIEKDTEENNEEDTEIFEVELN